MLIDPVVIAAIALAAFIILAVLLSTTKDDHRDVGMMFPDPDAPYDRFEARMSFRTPHEDAAGMQ